MRGVAWRCVVLRSTSVHGLVSMACRDVYDHTDSILLRLVTPPSGEIDLSAIPIVVMDNTGRVRDQ